MSLKLIDVSKLPKVSPNLITDFVIGVQSLGNGNYQAVLYPANYISGSGATLYASTLTGLANTYIATITGISSYVANSVFFFTCNATNTNISTVNINGLGAKNIHKFGSGALDSGDMVIGQVYGMIYDGTNFQIFSVTNNIEVAP